MKASLIAVFVLLTLLQAAHAITSEQRAHNRNRRNQQRVAQDRYYLMHRHSYDGKQYPNQYR